MKSKFKQHNKTKIINKMIKQSSDILLKILNVLDAKKWGIMITPVLMNFHVTIVYPQIIIVKDVHRKLYVLDVISMDIC